MNLMTGLLKYGREASACLVMKSSIILNPSTTFSDLCHRIFLFIPNYLRGKTWHFMVPGMDSAADKSKLRTEELLEVLGLSSVGNRVLQNFSGGMKRRVNLAIGVMHQPKVLFLDEPTVGVDVQSRHAIIHYLKKQNESGTTLIYTSHQLEEAAELCNKIALIDDGKIIAHDSLDGLLLKHGHEGYGRIISGTHR